ncbi:uncharacterized protein LOC125657650 isoform X2 [Ostrea edulis]|uniref:uncharacterized protein LOC125657650 isoform X2 n=1 Tax=Ostrea edulis TaxID=37623 RepID=UPI0024AE9A98|nr:uncharacterized protein LOC125657650 isoform X2 [Ostrea edulis]
MAVSWVLIISCAAIVQGLSLNFAPTVNPVVKDGKRSGFGQQFLYTPTTNTLKTTLSVAIVSTPSMDIVSPERPPANAPNSNPFIGVTLAPGIKCHDTPSANCSLYNATIICDAHGKYYEWARRNCLLTCGFCHTCEDNPNANCVLFNSTTLCDIHGSYFSWARNNCPLHCGFCKNNTVLIQLPTTNSPATTHISLTQPSHVCKDTEDCRLYKYTKICTDGSEYIPWAQLHCPVYCGFCQAPTKIVPCVDRISNCDEYVKDLCINTKYRIFREDNCRRYCKICTGLDSVIDYSSALG